MPYSSSYSTVSVVTIIAYSSPIVFASPPCYNEHVSYIVPTMGLGQEDERMAETKSSLVEERCVVHATPDVVYTVLSSAADMVGWLSNEARCEPHPGGIYDLRWNSGYAVHGKVIAAEKPRLLAVAWQGTDEPGETTVTFSVAAHSDGAEVTVQHSGFGRGERWDKAIEESHKGWAVSLECLQHLVETGIDLRDARRPLMGVSLGEPLTPERIAQEGIDTTSGVYLEGVIDGLSAQAAGLRAHDVITAVDGKSVDAYVALVNVLQGRRAGDRIEVAFVRGKEHKTVTLELKPRPIPEIPSEHNMLLATLLERYEKARTDVVKATAGVTEQQAGRAPSDNEWSAKEAIAHLSITERDLHCWLGDMILGNEQPKMPGNPSVLPEKLGAVLAAAPTVAALLNRFAQDQTDTLAIVAALRPEILANRARYGRIARTVFDMADHVHDHVGQIKAALVAAK